MMKVTLNESRREVELEMSPATWAAYQRQCERLGAPATGGTLLKAALHHAERIIDDPAYAAELRAKNEARRANRVDVEVELDTQVLREAEEQAAAHGVSLDDWLNDHLAERLGFTAKASN